MNQNLINIINEVITEVDQSSEKLLISLKSELAQAAQIVYNHWQQNEEGYCDSHGNGGICGDIADALAEVLFKHNIECTSVSSDHEVHVYVVAKLENEGIYLVDISPYTYETGGGYCWKKIPDVEIDSYDIIINKISSDPEDFNNYVDY